jgi:RND family efflux transporter MFP subunit
MIKRVVCWCLVGIFLFVFSDTWAFADSIPSGVSFDGLIEPHLVVEVGVEVPGIINTVKKDRGDMVEVGQVLATLRSGVERANLELARTRAEMESTVKLKEAALEFAKRNGKRVKELYDVNALALQRWDEAQTQMIMAENEFAQAVDQKMLYGLEYEQAIEIVKRKTIRSPISGVVMERYLSKGEYVEDKPIFKIAQITPLNVEVVLPVSRMRSVKVGMKGTVIPEAPLNGEYKATVTIVDRVVDAASGTFRVRLEMPNPKYKITPGLKCKVFFH